MQMARDMGEESAFLKTKINMKDNGLMIKCMAGVL